MVEIFKERGEQLALSRELMAKDRLYTAALALVSIHCAIAFNDALLFKLTGHHTSSADHMQAVGLTRKQCSSRKIGDKGLRHLEKLIEAKSKVSYSDKRTTPDAAETLAVASERFESWVLPLLQ